MPSSRMLPAVSKAQASRLKFYCSHSGSPPFRIADSKTSRSEDSIEAEIAPRAQDHG